MQRVATPLPKWPITILYFSDWSLNELLINCSSAERLQIAEESLRIWDFEHKLDEVLKQMNEQKLCFGQQHLDFEKKTKDLEEFVAKVKSDVHKLIEG